MKTKPFKSLLLSWLPALAGMSVLFYTSSLPGDQVHLPDFWNSDKLVHFSAYCILGLLISLRHPLRRRLSKAQGDSGANPQSGNPGITWPGRPDFRGMAAGAIYGFADEVHQLFVPLRSYDYADMAADALGVALGCWIYRSFTKRAERRKALGNARTAPG